MYMFECRFSRIESLAKAALPVHLSKIETGTGEHLAHG
jgi:hypothetical protein